MSNQQEIAKKDMQPAQDAPEASKALEEAQKDAAEERENERGYQ